MAASPQQVGRLIAAAQRLAALGDLTPDEAEGALLAALNYLAPSDAESSNERYMAQLPPDFKSQVQGFAEKLSEGRAARMARAREALLSIPDDEWEAAGGGQ